MFRYISQFLIHIHHLPLSLLELKYSSVGRSQRYLYLSEFIIRHGRSLRQITTIHSQTFFNLCLMEIHVKITRIYSDVKQYQHVSLGSGYVPSLLDNYTSTRLTNINNPQPTYTPNLHRLIHSKSDIIVFSLISWYVNSIMGDRGCL